MDDRVKSAGYQDDAWLESEDGQTWVNGAAERDAAAIATHEQAMASAIVIPEDEAVAAVLKTVAADEVASSEDGVSDADVEADDEAAEEPTDT